MESKSNKKIKFNFLDSKQNYQISFAQLEEEKIKTNIEFREIDSNKKESNWSLTQDKKSIHLLQSHITECLNFHSNNNLIPNFLPSEIDIKFINETYLSQFINSFREKEYTARTSNDYKNKVILLSTDLVNDFNTDNFKNNFLNICRKRIFGKCHDIEKTQKVLTETFFLHELAHQILNAKYIDTILISGLKFKTIKENSLKQITDNIQEAFCDSFSTYLSNIKNPEMEIIERFSIIRQEDNESNNKNYSILPYNISDAIKEVQYINESNIDKLVDVLLDNAITHSLNLAYQAILSHGDEIFVKNLSKNLIDITNNKNLKLDTPKNIVSTLRQELLKYNPVPQEDLDEQKTLMFKVKQLRKKVSKNKNEYFIKHKM